VVTEKRGQITLSRKMGSEKWGQITLSCHPPLHADPFFWKFTLTPFFGTV
jgi:hypothetical protein